MEAEGSRCPLFHAPARLEVSRRSMSMNPTLVVLTLGVSGLIAAPASPECRIAEIQKKLLSSSPGETPALFLQLASCDPAIARSEAPEAFKKVLGGAAGQKAAMEAVRIGAGSTVREWLDVLFAEERSQTLIAFGKACADHPYVVDFFAESEQILGDNFWKERWQRGVAECRAPQAQDMMRKALQNPSVRSDAPRYGSILSALCRNMGREAIPYLKALAITAEDENKTYVLDAFSDAAGLGSVDGADPAAAAEAVTAIVELSPALSPALVLRARQTVAALGDVEAGARLASVRFSSSKWQDGSFHWAVMVVERGTCRNGKTLLATYTGEAVEDGHYWPDQVRLPLEKLARAKWTFTELEKCKGEGTLEFLISDEPLPDAKALAEWKASNLAELQRKKVSRKAEISMEALRLP
jgi:hypothetical protein